MTLYEELGTGMTKKIFNSIFWTAMLVFIAAFFLIEAASYYYDTDEDKKQLIYTTDNIANAMNDGETDFLSSFNEKGYRMTWIAKNGTVLYDNQGDASKMDNHLNRPEVQTALIKGTGESERYSSTILKREVYYAIVLDDGTILRSAMILNSFWWRILSEMQMIIFITILIVVVSLLVAKGLSEALIRPLNNIDLDHPVKSMRKDYKEIMPLLERLEAEQGAMRNEERMREEAEELRREFTANVSHELKTPIHTISGYTELLKNGLVKEQDLEEFSGKIYKETQRMSKLVQDIIELSHLDEGASNMEWQDNDLSDIARVCVDRLKPLAFENNITLQFRSEPAKIYCIPTLLEEIVTNLTENAIKYNRPNGLVTVTVKEDKANGDVVLEVRDTGIGIPEEHLDRIFERFYRVDKSHSRAVGGTGLGLSIVKHAVMIHKGKIGIDSTPDVGTTMTVRFPAGY